MNRGSSDSSALRLLIRSRFNEAPIHESGKWRSAICPRPMSYCFNEAPIHESGKYGCHPDETRIELASMRPRFMNRGSGGFPWSERRFRARFNEAPIHESGKSR